MYRRTYRREGRCQLKIEFYKHNLGQEEKASILQCLDGLFLTTGDVVRNFEEEFANYLGLEYAVGLTSCTAALHLALLALDIGAGDEVITTPMTFIATATAIMHTGARPVFIDVEPDTGLMDAQLIEGAITAKTKAILPVHLYGQMCDMVEIRRIADKHGLAVIEDAAHCIEGERDGSKPGALGDIACFSFYATKNITSGEGGAIATNNCELAERVRMLRQHGMSKEAADRYSGNYQHWDMIECGWKYNMDNIQASLLLPQLRKIDQTWQRRRELFEHYTAAIDPIPQVAYPNLSPNSKSAFHLFTIWVQPERRDSMLKALGQNGIGTAVNYRAIHLLSFFRKRFGFLPDDFPIAKKIGDATISLPFYPLMNFTEIDYISAVLKNLCQS